MTLYKNYLFFKEQAGYCVGHRAIGALALARAEQWRIEQKIDFVWKHDDYTSEDDFEFEQDKQHVREHGAVGCVLYKPCPNHGLNCKHAEVLGSLWGITESLDNRQRDAYRRVVQAELALEAM